MNNLPLNQKISFKNLNNLAEKEMRTFQKQHRPNGVASLKCLMFDVCDYLENNK